MNSLPIRRLDFITIYSKNLEASRKFYADLLGFRILREVPNEFFQIEIAGVPICIDLDRNGRHENSIGLEVEDLAAATSLLRQKGLQVHSGSNDASQGKWVAVEDPDGNEIIFLVSENNAR